MVEVLAALIVLALVVYGWMVQPIRWFRSRGRVVPRNPRSRLVRLPDVWL